MRQSKKYALTQSELKHVVAGITVSRIRQLIKKGIKDLKKIDLGAVKDKVNNVLISLGVGPVF